MMKNSIHTSVLSRCFMGRNNSPKPFLGRLTLCILWVVSLTSWSVQAQTPTVAWQKLLGGTQFEEGRTTLQTTDGGYIMSGFTGSSNTGDVGTNHGGNDCWIVKMNALGAIQWQKLLGGDGNELITSMQQTTDGGYIISAYTNSTNSGDIGTNHGGAYDYWIIKLDALGNITWQKLLGGNGEDRAMSVKQTTEGGYIVSGYSYSSNSDDVAGTNHGDADIWVVKLDAAGNIIWQKLLGGNVEELAADIQQTTDGGYIVSGQTLSSNSGDVGTNHGYYDTWVVKLDGLGNIQWQKTLGGDSIEGSPFIQQTSDGGYLLATSTASSNTGDVGLNHGSFDAWFVKLDGLGNIQWQKLIGGSSIDIAYSFQKTTDGGFIMVGYTGSSNSGDITSTTKGGIDGWLLKLNASAGIEWQKTWGGSNNDYFYTVQQTTDGGYTVTGYTESSNSGDIGASHGSGDAWIIRLNAPCSFTPSVTGNNSVAGGETITLTGSTTTGTVVWSSDNTNIATVSQTGVVTGVGNGTASIGYAVTEGGCTAIATKSVTVFAFKPTQCYRIVNKVSGKVLEVKGASTADSAQIYQGSITGNRNQLWNFTKLSDGKYSIASVGSGKVMDILDNGPAGYCVEGTIIQQFPFDGTNSQRWRIEIQPDLSVKIYNGTCNKPLRLESGSLLDGASVGIKADFGTEAFKWYIQEVPCTAPLDPNQCYRIVNKATNKVLEIKDGSGVDGAQIYQWASTTNRLQQLWKTTKLGDGKYIITSMMSSKVMDVLDNTAAGFCTEGTIIQQFPLDYTNSQRWGLIVQPDGSYKIVNTTCNKYLRVESASTADGASVGIKNDFGSDAFKWYFQPADCFTGVAFSSTNATFGFEARASEGRAKLQWITNTGYKTDYFEVERMNAQGNFAILGRQNAEVSKDMTSYTFTDNDPLDGDNLYRINSIFQNGPPQYSDIKKVSFSKNDGISIFPNPADEFINVDLRKYEGKTVALSIYNSVGLLVKKQTIEKVSAAPQQIDVQGFGTGSYLLRVQSEGKREVTRLFHIAK